MLLDKAVDATEYLRIGFTNAPSPTAPPGLRLFIDHSRCVASDTDPNINATQIAPLPATALLRATDRMTGVTRVNATIVVDGGMIEAYATDAGVVITGLAAPSTAVPPRARKTALFVSDANAVSCTARGWQLAF